MRALTIAAFTASCLSGALIAGALGQTAAITIASGAGLIVGSIILQPI
jgi:hypothetical protein